ncbi:helix-turn-helix transcriptional regulator [Flavonifractor sp. An100]|uniref:helix-turn-helix domain-containing protein n=1 Tax=Flavonifractor sp. An100 TaxID=1965538 RepID=UPI000B395E83|nr:helix-turn-helix transcriptional regulator [Flavonifractor sp. An100]OUQ76548.1 XRE family transcriptional regulator [Flavonifractor sp. An100]
MQVDYGTIGGRVAKRRKELRLTQSQVAERCEISDQYLSNIERAVSIPSTEVVMRLAMALDTTPDEFLVGAVRSSDESWKSVAEGLRGLNDKQLELVHRFITWVAEQTIG